MIADRFHETVGGHDGRNRALEFMPRTGERMLIAGLRRTGRSEGEALYLPLLAAITDEPAPEAGAAGHDRTISVIKSKQLDAWLSPYPEKSGRAIRHL